jgi:hypothetical protein
MTTRRDVTIEDLLGRNDRDISLFRGYIVKLAGKPGAGAYIGDLERRIVLAERSNAILRAAWHL